MTTQKINSRLEEIKANLYKSKSYLQQIRSELNSASLPVLTTQQIKFWETNGYLTLPSFFSEIEMDYIIELHKKVRTKGSDEIVVDDMDTGRRCYLNNLSPKEREDRLKINDLYLEYEEIRNISLNQKLVPILTQFLPDIPVLCNTLSMDYGSQQNLHRDTLYMTPKTDNNLVATWIALEDCHADAGPLAYVPGSHKIPTYRFSNGQVHTVIEEMPQWDKYIKDQITNLQLKEEVFLAKKGDVFVWHAELVHGGSPINNFRVTRKSLVSHYWTKNDCIARGYEQNLESFNGAYWWNRAPQAV
jgi:hypothetical protein